MPSPFPGMDPYLEEPSGWPGVHHRLISVISDMLIEQVAPHYSVSIEERVYITDDDTLDTHQQIAPDVYLVERPTTKERSVTVAVTVTPPTIIERLPTLEVHDRYLAIYDRRSRELVTTLEILSPRNKARQARGHQEFVVKREAVFSTRTHWIEIDLLRIGLRPGEVAGKSDYYALLKRGNAGGRLEVWYMNVRDSLPRISVPLHNPHPDVVLDLQSAVDIVYTRGRYADDIDYTQPAPAPAFRPADAVWVSAHIAEWRSVRA